MCEAVEVQADMVPVEDVVGVVYRWLVDLGKRDGDKVCHGEYVVDKMLCLGGSDRDDNRDV
jgi:hypothetical protein